MFGMFNNKMNDIFQTLFTLPVSPSYPYDTLWLISGRINCEHWWNVMMNYRLTIYMDFP